MKQFLLFCISNTLAWMNPSSMIHITRTRIGNKRSLSGLLFVGHNTIEFQNDSKQFGRGERHLSAVLEEKDVVVVQFGSWYVDGVVVGDDTGSIRYEYCRVESLQVVWTHNCEHGVIRGYSIKPILGIEQQQQQQQQQEHFFEVNPTWDPIEFGPEQLVARIPVHWINETMCQSLVPWNEELWKE